MSHASVGPIAEYGSASELGVHLWAYPSPNDLFLNLVDSSGGYHFFSAPGTLVPGRWQHVAATYDGQTVCLFVDGAEVGSTLFGALTPKARGALDLYLGHRPYAGGAYRLTEALDEVAVYRRVLPAVRLQAHVSRGRGAG